MVKILFLASLVYAGKGPSTITQTRVEAPANQDVPGVVSSAAIKRIAAQNCPVSVPMEGRLTPLSVSSYLLMHASELKSPEDLVCCIVRDMPVRIVVAHSSIAGQNGSPSSPRVLLYTEQGPDVLGSIISINGGGTDVHQANSVEMLSNNVEGGYVELYDFAFSGARRAGITRNPTECMYCHGSGGTAPRAENQIKAFMDIAPWERIARPVPFINKDSNCPAEAQLLRNLSNRTTQSLRENPRYKCIDPEINDNITELNKMVGSLTDRRVAASLRGNPFRYVLVGLSTKCSNPLTWIPPEKLAQMSNTALLKPAFQTASTDREFLTAINAEEDRLDAVYSQKALEYKNSFNAINEGHNVDFNPLGNGGVRCNKDSIGLRSNLSTVETALANAVSPTHRRYLADSLARRRFTRAEMDARFIIESMGGDTQEWSTLPSGGYGKVPNFAPELISQSEQLKTVFNGKAPGDVDVNSPICAKLKELSLAALAGSTPAAGSTITTPLNGVR